MSCPICDGETTTSYRSFCSKRCADIDLGKWFNGTYAVPSRYLEGIENALEKYDNELQVKH
ncbi:DNA gyrase inhibitor YacG [Rhodobacterales bacterium 56_14_T64]|nr:DNA gyrase inhibitor YacG [Rhodobacterales bacterium 56_14_T64]